MANLGEITEIVNASELTLEVGSDNYIMLTNLIIHYGRTEDRTPTTDAGALYTYGKGDNWFTATILGTTPEFISWANKLALDGDGDMPETTFLIKAGNVGGSSITWTVTGVLRELDTNKPPEGKVTTDIFVRIKEDTVVPA